MLHSGSVTPGDTNPTPLIAGLTTPGQAYGSVFAGFIIIQSRTGNSGSVKVTGQITSSGAASTLGIALVAGEKVTLHWYGQPHSYDLATTFVTTNGTDAVDFVYGS